MFVRVWTGFNSCLVVVWWAHKLIALLWSSSEWFPFAVYQTFVIEQITGEMLSKMYNNIVWFDRYCGIRDPSWSELKHFVDFLNSQLQDCEENIFCNPDNVDDSWMQGTLKGFTSFVIRFMVTMSRVRIWYINNSWMTKCVNSGVVRGAAPPKSLISAPKFCLLIHAGFLWKWQKNGTSPLYDRDLTTP